MSHSQSVTDHVSESRRRRRTLSVSATWCQGRQHGVGIRVGIPTLEILAVVCKLPGNL